MQTDTETSPIQTQPCELIQPNLTEKSSQNLEEVNPKGSSHQRWKILFLICSSTFGSYFIQNLLEHAGQEKLEAFNIYERTEMVDKELIMGYLSFIPMIAGVMIHRFGIVKTFRYFALIMILGSLLIVPGFMIQRYFLYLLGVSLMKGSSLVLWVAQIYMTIQWFKGKELSLAIGILGVSKSLSYLIAIQFSSHVESIGILKVLFIGVILSVFLAATFMKKINLVAKQEEDFEGEEASLNQSAIGAMMVTITCFVVAEGARSLYFYLMFPSHEGSLISIITKSEYFGIFAPILLLPLFGSYADKEGGRKTAIFSSFLLLFIGNLAFYLLSSSDTVLMPLFASTLFQVGSYLFEVSFWAILGYFTPKKVLAVILGICFSLKEFGPRFFGPYMNSTEKFVGFAIGLVLVIGAKSMSYAWKEFNGKEEAKLVEDAKLVGNDMNKKEEETV